MTNLVRIRRTVHQKPLAALRELAQLVFPLRHPVVDVLAALDHLAIARAAGEQVDGQAVGDELVLLAAPVEFFRVHAARDLHAPQAGAVRLELPAIGDVELDAAADLAGVLLERRLKIMRTEPHAGEIEAIELLRQLERIEPRRAEEPERMRGAAPF